MTITTDNLEVRSKGENDIIDLTNGIQELVKRHKLRNGVVTVFVTGSTAALTTMEYEPGLLKDFVGMLERIAPKNMYYEHEKRWHDDNGHSHVKSSLIGPSLTIPFSDGKLTLGTWQQIVLVELDTRPRSRKLVVQIIGE